MTDRARELVERLREPDYIADEDFARTPERVLQLKEKWRAERREAADFIEQYITPPEVDTTQWANIKVMLLKRVHEFPWDNAGGPDTFKLVNPDGPAAVDFIERSLTENARLRRKLKEFGCEEVENVDEHIASLTPPEGDTVSDEVLLNAATPEQINRANDAVFANLDEMGVPKYDSAFGYACALTAIIQSDAALQSRVSPQAGMREVLEEAKAAMVKARPFVEGCEPYNSRESLEQDKALAHYDEALEGIDAALSTAPIPMSEAERISLENGGDPC